MGRSVCDHALRIYNTNAIWWENSQFNSNGTTPMVLPPIGMGGEKAGWMHLEDFVNNHSFHAKRNLACVENHQSSRLSHHLAFGSLSPRRIVASARTAIEERNERKRKQQQIEDENRNASRGKPKKAEEENDGTWLISHMAMRDFFLYTCLASGSQFYRLEGVPVSQKVASSIS